MISEIVVELGERAYPIQVDRGLLYSVGEACREQGLKGQSLLVSDENVFALYGAEVLKSLRNAGYQAEAAVVPAGESSKCGDQLFRLYDAALGAGLDRAGFVVALGGGVVGDLAGYLAASYLRGIPFVQVPTTILAMVDSSVGGKTGINLPHGKNLVGAFHQPRLVLADIDALATLPAREVRSGLAEVVKYGTIRDADFFAMLESSPLELLACDIELMRRVILRSCAIKAEVVGLDERESGLRAILNFGHTLAHAIEQNAGYGAWLHGEAVAAGMVYAAQLSERVKGFPKEQTARLIALLKALELPVQWPGGNWEAIVGAMSRDKKADAGLARFVLAREIGSVEAGVRVQTALLEKVWRAGSAEHGCGAPGAQ